MTTALTTTANLPAEHADWLASTLLASVPPSTAAAYRSAAKGVARHCDGIPDDVAVIARIRELDEDGRSVSSMRTACAVARLARRNAGLPPLGDGVALAVAAIAKTRRRNGDTARQSAPIRHADLPRIDATTTQPRARGTGKESDATAAARANLDSVIVRLLRGGLMRVGELALASMENIERTEDGATLTFHRTKSDTGGECVINAALLAAIDAVPREDGDTRIVPLSARQIARRVKRMAEDAGIEGASSHGCRVGMARDLASHGVGVVEMQNAGGWKSPEMPAHYTRREAAESGPVARLFGDE